MVRLILIQILRLRHNFGMRYLNCVLFKMLIVRRDYEQDIMMLLMNIFPSITAPKGLKARRNLAKAFLKYFQNKGHLTSSELVKARWDISNEWKMSLDDIAAFEPGNGIASLANTFPTTFWMLTYIFSHPDVLAECRNEVTKIIDVSANDQGTFTHKIDMLSVKESCPVIVATLQEVLRHTSVGVTVREVMEDTELNGFTLKKGNTLLTPASIMHTNREIWGNDPHAFDHRRFLKAPGKKIPGPVNFRAFGGGHTLCPGRHFATTEILATAVMFIARFDMEPNGPWPLPDRSNLTFFHQIIAPDEKLQVTVKEREGLGGNHEWTFLLSDSEILLAMVAEDAGEM
jgi:cytochrome P450